MKWVPTTPHHERIVVMWFFASLACLIYINLSILPFIPPLLTLHNALSHTTRHVLVDYIRRCGTGQMGILIRLMTHVFFFQRYFFFSSFAGCSQSLPLRITDLTHPPCQGSAAQVTPNLFFSEVIVLHLTGRRVQTLHVSTILAL